jgi:hypothetical protein
MNFDLKDKALLKASALVGYCQSADPVALKDDEVRERWILHLEDYAGACGGAINKVFADPTDEQSK